jgi:hypothetical protein
MKPLCALKDFFPVVNGGVCQGDRCACSVVNYRAGALVCAGLDKVNADTSLVDHLYFARVDSDIAERAEAGVSDAVLGQRGYKLGRAAEHAQRCGYVGFSAGKGYIHVSGQRLPEF